MPIIKKIIDKLIKKNISISVAESCTGGLIANTITKYSGVSKIFYYGLSSNWEIGNFVGISSFDWFRINHSHGD